MAEDIKDQLARLIKDRVRLHLEPNTLAQASEGCPVALNGGEADHVAGIALEVLADLGLIAAHSTDTDGRTTPDAVVYNLVWVASRNEHARSWLASKGLIVMGQEMYNAGLADLRRLRGEADLRAEKAEGALAALTERSQTRDHLADREQELARLRLAHLEKEVVLYADTNRLIEAELETARTKFAALDALHPHTELNWWHPCKNHSITDEEPTLAACPNCLIEPVMGCPRCGDDACEIRAILHPDSPDVTP